MCAHNEDKKVTNKRYKIATEKFASFFVAELDNSLPTLDPARSS